MPTYRLKCIKCGRERDQYFAKVFTEDEINEAGITIKCKWCGEHKWTKLPTAPIGFKGLPTPIHYPKGEK